MTQIAPNSSKATQPSKELQSAIEIFYLFDRSGLGEVIAAAGRQVDACEKAKNDAGLSTWATIRDKLQAGQRALGVIQAMKKPEISFALLNDASQLGKVLDAFSASYPEMPARIERSVTQAVRGLAGNAVEQAKKETVFHLLEKAKAPLAIANVRKALHEFWSNHGNRLSRDLSPHGDIQRFLPAGSEHRVAQYLLNPLIAVGKDPYNNSDFLNVPVRHNERIIHGMQGALDLIQNVARSRGSAIYDNVLADFNANVVPAIDQLSQCHDYAPPTRGFGWSIP